MPVGGGAGYAQGLRDIAVEKRAAMGPSASGLDQPSDAMKGQGALMTGAADLIKAPGIGAKAQAEGDQIRQNMEDQTEAGLFMSDFFKGMMMPSPDGKGQVFKPEFRMEPGNTGTPNLAALTQHLFATASKHALSPAALGSSIDMMQKQAGYSSAVAAEWMKGYQSIYEKQRLDDIKRGREDYRNAATQDDARKALTQTGLAQQPANEPLDLTKSSMEGIGAKTAGSSENLQNYTVQFPGGSVATFAVPLGTQFNPPEGGVIIDPPTDKGLTGETAAKMAGVQVWNNNWQNIQGTVEDYFVDVEGMERQGNIVLLNLANGGLNQDLKKLHVMLTQGMETQLRLLSGAAIPEDEVARQAKLYRPRTADDGQTIKFRIGQLNQFLNFTHENIDPQGKYVKGQIPKELIYDFMDKHSSLDGEGKDPPLDPKVKAFIEANKEGAK